ncbi:hypothetical protein E4U17_000854 [Claviceps sp. LM77 group G4]|nr:hypothetical protein E4U17_000854 [Claviceps sp. LM77 group G4]KAG6049430.1 hypothetical protein E4U33_000858 [Claviceps sp. LM78 group G4]KAG6066290.1 hypothetical protein E4U16_000283 [Claviceps sp. LM84 group G4]
MAFVLGTGVDRTGGNHAIRLVPIWLSAHGARAVEQWSSADGIMAQESRTQDSQLIPRWIHLSDVRLEVPVQCRVADNRIGYPPEVSLTEGFASRAVDGQ